MVLFYSVEAFPTLTIVNRKAWVLKGLRCNHKLGRADFDVCFPYGSALMIRSHPICPHRRSIRDVQSKYYRH